MNNIGNKIKTLIMSLSFQERRKKEYAWYSKEIDRLREMPEKEFIFEYSSTKAKYEHKKNLFSVLMMSIIISVLMGVWKYFFAFSEKLIAWATSNPDGGVEAAKIVFTCLLVLMLSLMILVFAILMMQLKNLYKMNRYLTILEEIRRERID